MMLLLFGLLSCLSLITGFAVVFIKNPIYSLLSLILCFFTIAGHYVLLNASFLAVIHIIVYAGAIMVLFLFMMMLMNLNGTSVQGKPLLFKALAITASGLMFVSLIIFLAHSALPVTNQAFLAGKVESLGHILFTEYAIPFELTSVLFLASVIGVVSLGKSRKGEPKV